MPAMASDRAVDRVPAGAVAFHFVFDLAFPQDPQQPPEFVGYIAFIEGVNIPASGDNPLFAGPPSEDTAYFTVRVTRPLPPRVGLPVPDSDLGAWLILPGGQFTVYYDSNPDGRDWGNADTFSEGVPIAVFEESALLSTEASGTFGTFPGVFYNAFSGKLIDSAPIRFNGQRINFRRIVPNGVTVTNFGNTVRILPDFSAGVSGGGTAIAIGGRARNEDCDD